MLTGTGLPYCNSTAVLLPVGGPADRVSALWTTLAGLPEWFALAMALTFFCVIVRCGYREWGRRADTRSTRPGAL